MLKKICKIIKICIQQTEPRKCFFTFFLNSNFNQNINHSKIVLFQLNQPTGMAMFEDSLYIANSGPLLRCTILGPRTSRRCQRLKFRVNKHLAVEHPILQQISNNNNNFQNKSYFFLFFFFILLNCNCFPDENPCKNNSCDYLCVLSIRGPRCLCADGTFVKMGKSCPLSVNIFFKQNRV